MHHEQIAEVHPHKTWVRKGLPGSAMFAVLGGFVSGVWKTRRFLLAVLILLLTALLVPAPR